MVFQPMDDTDLRLNFSFICFDSRIQHSPVSGSTLKVFSDDLAASQRHKRGSTVLNYSIQVLMEAFLLREDPFALRTQGSKLAVLGVL